MDIPASADFFFVADFSCGLAVKHSKPAERIVKAIVFITGISLFELGCLQRSITDFLLLTNARSRSPGLRSAVCEQASGRTPSVIPSSPEVILCQHPHPERFPQSKHFPWKNEFAGEPTNSTSS